MKNQQTCQESTLMNVLFQRFREASRRKEVLGIITTPLTLYQVDKEDRNLCYLTDGHHTILALSTRKLEEINCHPYNFYRKPFYLGGAKYHMFLNWTKQHEPFYSDQEHPYNPHFHFKEDHEQFEKRREKYRLNNPCETYHLSQYEIAIVNIQQTGYYAPALILHDYKNSKSRSPPQYLNLNCILYEPAIQEVMQKYRLDDIRQVIAMRCQYIKKGSLFYIARRENLNQGKIMTSHVVGIDWSKEILQHEPKRPYTFVLASDFGENSGPCGVVNPKQQPIDKSFQISIHRQHLEDLFNNLRIEDRPEGQIVVEISEDDEVKNENTRKENKLELWSDTESEEGERPIKEMIEEGSLESESDDDDDALKKLYAKMAKHLSKRE